MSQILPAYECDLRSVDGLAEGRRVAIVKRMPFTAVILVLEDAITPGVKRAAAHQYPDASPESGNPNRRDEFARTAGTHSRRFLFLFAVDQSVSIYLP